MNQGRRTVGSLARGLRVLSILGAAGNALGLSELAKLADLDKATTHRLARVLLDLGYIQQDPDTRHYRLGVRVLDLGFAYLASIDVRELALPHMQALAREFGESVSLSMLDGTDIVYIERIQPRLLRVSVQVHVGSRLPAYCTSMGKALLAYLPPRERGRLLNHMRLNPWTPHTITDRRELSRQLDEIPRRGFAVNDEENALGLRSVAAAIRDRNGTPLAAINVAVSSMVPWQELKRRIAPRVMEAAAAVSAQLGWTAVTEQAG